MANSDLRILLFAGPFEVRGSCAYTLRLAENLHHHNISASVVCSDARMVDREVQRELPITEYMYLDVPIIGRVVRRMLKRDISRNAPTLVHLQSRKVLSQGTWLAKQLNCPFILTLHDFLQPREKFRFDPRLGKRVIAVSDAVQSGLLAKSAIAAELVSVIHSGVEADANSEVEPIFEPGRVPVVGTASPLEEVKGLPFFLKAASQVLKAGFDVEFLVSGAGPEEANLRQLAEKLGIQRLVTFVPNMYDFTTSLAAMDIFCLPSLQQGLGTIMLDAMSLGRPVIATKVGGVEGVVQDNHTGLIVAPSDSNALASRIIELLKDPVRARNIGKAAREMVIQHYGVETMVRKTANLYREVIESTQS